ncbi:MAG: nucleotidyltransferase family protein [Kiloniellaceae bacterium]
MTGQPSAGDARFLLPRLVTHPETLASLSLAQWDLVIRQAMRAGISARLCFQLEDIGALDDVPERPRRHLESARTVALKHQRDIRWEVACVRRALEPIGIPMTLLKGAAYVMGELPPARGRLFADIDFMVPRDRIGDVERTLIEADWVSTVEDPYDQQYYRRWTHQIPPLQHYRRNTVLDVHHTIIEVTARTAVDPRPLAAESLPLQGDERLRILAPADMILHSALHLFSSGEFDRGMRDLLDINDLLRHFGAEAGFWEQLAGRAETLGLTYPLFLTLRYLERLLGLDIPGPLRQAAARWQPAAPRRALLDALFLRALRPDHVSCDGFLTGTARWLLYVRAHHLRMPTHLLVPHLLRKSFPQTQDD